MKKFITSLLCLILFLTPSINAKGLVNDEKCKNEKYIKNLYKENNDNIVAVLSSNRTYYLNNDDIYLMSQVVYGESRGEPYIGKVGVASVILNRLISPSFPSTVKEVVLQDNAFSCVSHGTIKTSPDKASYDAVMDAVKGNDPTKDALYFYNPKISTCKWMKNIHKKNTMNIGNHVFFNID